MHGRVEDCSIDEVGMSDERVHRDSSSHRVSEHPDAFWIDSREFLRSEFHCLSHGIYGIDRVASILRGSTEGLLFDDREILIGECVIAIVRVEYGESSPSEIVLLTLESSTERVDIGIDMSVIQDHERICPISFRDIHDARDTQSVGEIGYLVSRVCGVIVEDFHELESTSCRSMGEIVG